MSGYPDGFKTCYWQWNAGILSMSDFRKKVGLPKEDFDRYLRTYDAEQLFKNEAKNIEKERAAKQKAEEGPAL